MHSRWSTEKANEWYARQSWLIGCNFIPSSAINQLEMWQEDTFDPNTIDRELGWAAGIGFNTVRTYLHDLAWEADPEGFKRRIEQFINITSRHGIRPILVFFDDCWNPNPRSGTQPAPVPGVHNSGWVQSPGLAVVNGGQSAWGRLERYIKDVIGTFAHDERILHWDLYNEPGNSGNGVKSMPLLEATFEWARSAKPAQPLSAGVWTKNKKLNDFQLSMSDIITFHNYSTAKNLDHQITELKKHGRPLICTEWMARTRGSLVRTNLAVFAREKVGCLNWGLVAGKTNTIYRWRTSLDDVDPLNWTGNRNAEPQIWFHDLFRADGTPYDPGEIELFKRYQGVS
jgi:hypothetical protein